MFNEIKNALKDQTTLFALVVQVACSDVPVICELPSLPVFAFSLILIVFPGFLTGILKPHHDNTSWEVQQVRKLLKFIILWVSIGIKEVLQDSELVVSEACSRGPLASPVLLLLRLWRRRP